MRIFCFKGSAAKTRPLRPRFWFAHFGAHQKPTLFARSWNLLLKTVLFAFAAPLFAGTAITPTTTLAIETGNNTSTAPSFAAESDGNEGPSNISKVSIRSLLYAGSATKIYAHLMPWFGGANHMNVGYSSDDPTQVKKQVDDMLSRGIQGTIIDWYGPNFTTENTTTQLMVQEAQSRGGNFSVAVMEDGGQLQNCARTAGCDVTQEVINDLNYAYNNFEVSSAYMRVNGRPVVFFFDGTSYPVDWSRVSANVSGNPLFVFRNSGAFTHAQSNGGFSWIAPLPDPTNMSIAYLDGFYNVALGFSAENTFASAYKGFNDTLAAWSQNRIVNQQCGQTWLATMAEIGKYYSAGNPLEAIQLVTWNDYEEGTELETGIDNCVAIAAAIAGSTLSWSISGQENTLDHYTIFISTDGQNLMPLTTVATGIHALDLTSFGLSSGNYTLYVKAVGKPSLLNHISGPVTYSVNPPAPPPPVAKLSVTPNQGVAPVNVNASTAGSSAPAGSIVSTSIDFGDGTVVRVAADAAASHLYANPGSYVIRTTVTDNLGAASTVSASASVAAAASVTITTGARFAAFGLPVHVVVKGYSGNSITQMQLWLDGKLVAQCQTNSMQTTIRLRRGAHQLTATAKDSSGASFSATVSVPGP